MICEKCRLNQRLQEACIQCRLDEAQQEAQTVKKEESCLRTETDAIAGELKRLSAHHLETKKMLTDRQREVAQLAELKAQLEGQVADFDSKITRTEQERYKTQNTECPHNSNSGTH